MKEPVKARPGIPGDEPDWDSIPDFVVGRDGKLYRKVPTPDSPEDEKQRFLDSWRSKIR